MNGRVEVGGATALVKVTPWLGIAIVMVCVFVVALGHNRAGDSVDLFGSFLLVGMPAIPLVLIVNGRPHHRVIAVTSSVLVVIVEVLVVLAFLRDTHSTSVLGFLYSLGAAWIIWSFATAIEGLIDSLNRPTPPRPDNPECGSNAEA